MYDPENEGVPSERSDAAANEYAYGGFEQDSIYSDAHYTPEGESAVPPRYYTPPEPKKPAPKRKKSGRGLRAVGLIALCLVCALLGGIVGAGFMSGTLSERVDALEQQRKADSIMQAVQSAIEPASGSVSSAQTTFLKNGGALSASEIYARACEQVVGITTEITYTNYFGMRSSSAVSGSGFIVSSDGYIVTNFHVIELAAKNGKDVNVILHDGTRHVAAIVGYEEYNDIAVLKIDANGLSAASLGNSDALSVGDVVYAVGNPLGELDFSMSTGHVSALDRLITTDEGGVAINMFQIDAAVNSGNSGGPVYNAAGEVVGIVTAKYASSGVEGLGFAIPSNDAAGIVSDLVTKGYVTGKAYMGIVFDTEYNSANGRYYASYWGMPAGTYVKSVDEGSCAEKAGIQAKDIITKIGDYDISSYHDLAAALRNFKAGESTTVTVYRGEREIVLNITFDEAK